VIALSQMSVYAVASGKAGLTMRQQELIRDIYTNVFVLYDFDQAGVRAAVEVAASLNPYMWVSVAGEHDGDPMKWLELSLGTKGARRIFNTTKNSAVGATLLLTREDVREDWYNAIQNRQQQEGS
jgi:DNA primase